MATYEKLHVLVHNVWTSIVDSKAEHDSFNKQFMKLAPALQQYIAARLSTSVKTGNLPANKYKVADFVDELFIASYDHIEQFGTAADYYQWLLVKLEELLDDVTTEEEFNDFFFQNIENYTQQEWDSMAEEYSTDADGDYLMLEDFEDASYPKYQYTLRDVFVDNTSDEMINHLSERLSQDQVHQHIQLVIQKLTLEERIAFQQSVLLGPSVPSLAEEMTASSEASVDRVGIVREKVRKSFAIRYK